MTKTWEAVFEAEIYESLAARRAGNQGKSRVCARRAAGAVIREYLAQKNIPPLPTRSALNHLRYLAAAEDESPEVRRVAGHFILQIQEDHTLPAGIDLVADARWLALELLGKK